MKRINRLLRSTWTSIEALDEAIREGIASALRVLDSEEGEKETIEAASELAVHEEIILSARAVRAGAVDFLREKALMSEALHTRR